MNLEDQLPLLVGSLTGFGLVWQSDDMQLNFLADQSLKCVSVQVLIFLVISIKSNKEHNWPNHLPRKIRLHQFQ